MKASENYLLSILSNNDVTFFIPPYQRNYEWGRDQCEVFLQDILKTMHANLKGNSSEHFFGTVTYFQSETVFGQPNKLVLIDGQQRITTTMLFLVALRDVIDNESIQAFIDSKYLKNCNATEDVLEYKIKLKQVETDWSVYCAIILQKEILIQEKNSAVYQNYMFFVNALNNLKAENQCLLEEIIKNGLNKFSIVTVELQPEKNGWENPQEIFESMNSLGKPLSLADLVRNYLLLGKNPNEQNLLYKKYWLHLEQQLQNQISNFIRDFMQLRAKSFYKQATDKNYKELYANFKSLFKGHDTEILLSALSKYATIYSYIVNGKTTGNILIDQKLADIRTIGVSTAYSFIMGLLSSWKNGKLTDKELFDIFEVLIIYFVRRRIIGLAAGENKNIPQLICELPNIENNQDKKDMLFNILSHQENSMRLPNDFEMEQELSVMNFYNFRLAQFVFLLLEESITKARPFNNKELQIEHIMPQTLDKNGKWREELGEDADRIHQEYINNIGNLTLIRQNQELHNHSFAEKKKIYEEKAGMQIAKTEIINRTRWNKNSIQNREKWIIEYLLKEVFPIPESMRRSNNFSTKIKKGLSFEALQIIGQKINYISDKSIEVEVVGDRDVIFEGKKWKLSPLTREIETRKGTVNASGAYQGAQYWEYDGLKLADIM